MSTLRTVTRDVIAVLVITALAILFEHYVGVGAAWGIVIIGCLVLIRLHEYHTAILQAVGVWSNELVSVGARYKAMSSVIAIIIGACFGGFLFGWIWLHVINKVAKAPPLVVQEPDPVKPPPVDKAPDGIISDRIASGWTSIQQKDAYTIYLIVDTTGFPQPLVAAMSQENAKVKPELLKKVVKLWAGLSPRVPGAKPVQTDYGDIKNQEFVEHLSHIRGQNTVRWNYEVLQEGNSITPQNAPTIDLSIGEFSADSQGIIEELDSFAVHQIKRRYVEVLPRVSP